MYRQLLLHYMIKVEQQRLEQAKTNLEHALYDLPKGSVYKRNNRFYHVFRINGKQTMKSIKDPVLLHQLRIRKHIEKTLPQITKRLNSCNAFIENDTLYDVKEILSKIPAQYKPVQYKEFWLPGDVDPEEWGQSEYEQNPMSIEKPSQTSGGRLVRSKSEAFIGSELEGVPLVHRYEPKLVLLGEVFYPDFMFILPNCRMIVIWEHFGRMDDPEYAKKAMHKIEAYSKAGWVLGKNFFFTYETSDMPFSFPGAKAKLSEILALDKVEW